MTQEENQGKWFRVRNIREFEITEFELLWSNCTYLDTQVMEHCAASEAVGIVLSITG